MNELSELTEIKNILLKSVKENDLYSTIRAVCRLDAYVAKEKLKLVSSSYNETTK